MSTSKVTLKHFLLEHSVSEIINNNIDNQKMNVVELESTQSPIEAASILWKNNIVGAPVWDNKSKNYIGFFEMRDFLSSVIALSESVEDEAGRRSKNIMGVSMDRPNEHMVKEELLQDKDGKKWFVDADFRDKKVSYLAARNPFAHCKPDATLYDLCECLNERHCHRVPIVGDDEKCHNIVSQSVLVKFISENCPRDKLQENIKEAKIPYRKKVVSVIDTTNASDAFKLLDNKRLSGIAVVDENGKLVGNTSARDVKLAAIDEGNTAMDMDILSYLAKVRQAVLQKKERYPCCHVHEDATVEHIIAVLAKTGYHRVFVVDDNIRPIGVISVTDITTFATKDD